MKRPSNRIAAHRATRGRLVAALVAALPQAAAAQCDLKAEFVAPTATSLPAGAPVTWTLRYTNVAASGTCAANQVRLNRQSSPGSVAVTIGGSGSAQDLPALAPRASVNLSYTETGTPSSGSHTYRPAYASPHHDADNLNHHPTHTVTYTPSATLTPKPDLTIAQLSAPAPGIRVGPCNVLRVRVGNAGGPTAGPSQLRVRVHRPGLPGDVADTRTVPLGDVPAGQSRDVEVRGIQVPLPGPWRLEVIADATGAIAEADESNNRATMDHANVAQLCPP